VVDENVPDRASGMDNLDQIAEEPVGDLENKEPNRHASNLRTNALVVLHVLPISILGMSLAGTFTATELTGHLAIWTAIVGWTTFSYFSWRTWSAVDAQQQVECLQFQSFRGIIASFFTQTVCTFGTLFDCVEIPWMWCFYFLVGTLQGLVSFYIWFRLSPFVAKTAGGTLVQPFTGGTSVERKLMATWRRRWAVAAAYLTLMVIGFLVFAKLCGELRVDDTLFPDPKTSLHRKPYPDNYVSFTVITPGSPLLFDDKFVYHFWLLCGTPVVASRGGNVIYIWQNVTDTYWSSNGSYYINNKVEIDHGDGTRTVYSCIKEGSAFVKEGDFVEQGANIALSGMGGSFCTVPGVTMITYNTEGESIPVSFQDIGIPRPLQFN